MDYFYHTPTHPPIRKTQPTVLAGFGFHRTAEEETKAPPGAEFVHNEKKNKTLLTFNKGHLDGFRGHFGRYIFLIFPRLKFKLS